jgi:hypothetical protein
VVALPDQLFYNTGISTASDHQPQEARAPGRVNSRCRNCSRMRKSLGTSL